LAHSSANGFIASLASEGVLHVPASSTSASQQLREHFPPGTIKRQTTIAVVMPESIEQLSYIRRFAAGLGFTVVRQRFLELTDDELTRLTENRPPAQSGFGIRLRAPPLYSFDQPETENSRHLCVLALRHEEAVACWQQAMGPEDADKARNDFPRCLRSYLFRLPVAQRPKFWGGGVHGSVSAEGALADLRHFFPDLLELDAPAINMASSKSVLTPLLCALRSPFDVAPKQIDDASRGDTDGARCRSLTHVNSMISACSDLLFASY
jgi:hypothetical protein